MVHSELVGGCHKLPAILNYIHTPLSASASYTVPIHVKTVGTKSQMFSILLKLRWDSQWESSTYDCLVGTCAEVLCLQRVLDQVRQAAYL